MSDQINEWEQLGITKEQWQERKAKWRYEIEATLADHRMWLRKFIKLRLGMKGQDEYRRASLLLPETVDIDKLYTHAGLNERRIASSYQDAYHHYHFTNAVLLAVMYTAEDNSPITKCIRPCLIGVEEDADKRLDKQVLYYSTLRQYVQSLDKIDKATNQPNRITNQNIYDKLIGVERKLHELHELIQRMESYEGTAKPKRNNAKGKARQSTGVRAA